MRKFVLYSIVLLNIPFLFSQFEVPSGYRFVKTWRVSEQFAKVDSIEVDTLHLNFQDENALDRLSIANSYNGNLGSPIQPKVYFDQLPVNDFIFANAYLPYMMNVQNATFYNTKTPFTYLNYKTGGTTYRAEDNIKFLFTQNVNKNFNIGTTLDYLYSPGEYAYQGVNRFAGSFFGSYSGKHYSATALFSTNSLKGQESGGLEDPTSIYSSWSRKDLATNLIAQSDFKQNQIFYNHQYSIGIERPIRISEDSVRMEYVPVTRFAHTFKYDKLSRRYYENSVNNTFYTKTYLTGDITNDTTSLVTISNNLSVNMEEEFNKWLDFGLTAYVENEIQRFYYLQDTTLTTELESNTKIGGILSKQRGNAFKYNVLAEIDLLGYKIGDFLLKGDLGGFFKLWNDSISLVANGFIRSDEPSKYYQYYRSNHFQWDNNFGKTYRTNVGGTFSIPTRNFSLNVSVENITNRVYFDDTALPMQYGGNIQVLAANLKQDFHVGKFTLENNVIYQLSSQQSVLPLPTLALFHSLYYHDIWFKVLSVQFGANVRYNTEYYAPAYMPATGQYYTQSDTKIGNYPLINPYLNFHLKRTRFFLEYFNVNQLFMDGAYYSMPNYPMNPAIFKMGISWNFYD